MFLEEERTCMTIKYQTIQIAMNGTTYPSRTLVSSGTYQILMSKSTTISKHLNSMRIVQMIFKLGPVLHHLVKITLSMSITDGDGKRIDMVLLRKALEQ